jgi:NAD(P)-dependent dehydrogenase (short-subunit alcohol dehydrogenase family)
VAAILGPGDEGHRAAAVAAAQAGAAVAVGSLDGTDEAEFAINSIANEVWVMGQEQFARTLDAAEPTAIVAFADEVVDRLASCDLLAVLTGEPLDVEIDELSRDEWDPALLRHLTVPFLATQAFGRAMQRQHSGTILLDSPGDAHVFAAAVTGAMEGLADAANKAWGTRGVRVEVVRGDVASRITELLTDP